MAKMNELEAALKALLKYSEGIQETVREIRAIMTEDDADDSRDTAQGKQAEQPEITNEAAKADEPTKVYSLQDVRALLKAKTDQGYRTEVKALLKAHGAERLPDIDPKEFYAMMKEAEEIGA